MQADGGSILVLESEKSAMKRGAKILAEIKGYESCSIADHIYKPNKLGIQKVMGSALVQAGWHPTQIDMINGHATATKLGDPVEAEALKEVLATPHIEMLKEEKFASGEEMDKSKLKDTVITAYKGHLGHLNLASGSTEIALCL